MSTTYTSYDSQSLSRMWGVHEDHVLEWIKDGAIKQNPQRYAITDSEVQQFVNSEKGRALINEARLAPNPTPRPHTITV
jgi:hypothetical protein